MKHVLNGITIECIRGNIASQPDMDAVVNAANAQLRSGGGVAGAIHRAAGPGLEKESCALAPILPGQAVVTSAHGLPNRFVIHCLGPVYGRDEPADKLLADCYANALHLAEQRDLRSIAFPAISTGIFGYPMEAAARVALKTVLEYIPRLSAITHIRFVLFDHGSQELCEDVLEEMAGQSTDTLHQPDEKIKKAQKSSGESKQFFRTAISQKTSAGQMAISSEKPLVEGLALFTDLYELTMLQAYFEEDMTAEAVFTLFFRRLPEQRNFLVACGLETLLNYLETIRFSDEDIHYLSSLGQFSRPFLNWLGDYRFTGDVYAVPEGTPVFGNEPILEIVAPLPQAQLIETIVMNQIHLQTILATKANRVVESANGRPVIDFASRRMHGIDAALTGARAFWVGGIAGTSNVLAGKLFGLPVAGTMAHSYIQAHHNETSAYRAFVQLYPETILLVDTYDTLGGIREVIGLAKELGENFRVKAVRLDSGNLLSLSREARHLLNNAGLNRVEIFASGGLDEYAIRDLLSAGAPIDAFGVGSGMGVSRDAPDLDLVYKLSEYAGRGRLKLSTGKPVLPGRKQVFRIEEDGRDVRDVIACEKERQPGRPLLVPVMRNGKRLSAGHVDLETTRRYAHEQIARLHDRVRGLSPADPPFPVEVSARLSDYQKELIRKVAEQHDDSA